MAIRKQNHIFAADLVTVEQRLRELARKERESVFERGCY